MSFICQSHPSPEMDSPLSKMYYSCYRLMQQRRHGISYFVACLILVKNWKQNVHFVFQLLQKEASKRLGCGPGGSKEIKNHKWFKSINWKKLEAREIRPSFCPKVAGNLCVANFEECWTTMPILDTPAATPKSHDNPFKGFTYVRPASFLQTPP